MAWWNAIIPTKNERELKRMSRPHLQRELVWKADRDRDELSGEVIGGQTQSGASRAACILEPGKCSGIIIVEE